jgi:hypothetical protein
MGVLFVAKTGDDTTGDGSSGLPYLTIGKAITVANPGDEISIGNGTYSENLTINKSLALFSTNADKTLVTITSAVKTIAISHSTNNVYIRNLTIITTSTTVEAIGIDINKDFSVNPSGLPILATLCENININRCQITFNKTALTVNAKDSLIKQCTFSQVGATSTYTVFLIYTIDNLSILENTHTTATANMNRFIYLATSGAGDYRRNKLIVKQNTVNITTVSPGHFMISELVLAHPSGDKLTYDVQDNTHTTTQASTGGLFILFPTSSSVLQNTLSTAILSIIANNTVINPYRGWLYVDITSATPSPMGSTYFSIYSNTFTGTKSQRPGSYDVDGQTNVLISTTPASTTGWANIYNTTTATTTLSVPVDEQDALTILTDALQTTYPGESLSVPLSLFSIDNVDDPILLSPVIHQSASALTYTNLSSETVELTNPNADYRYMFQVLDTPYKTGDALSFVIKVYNNITNELVSTSLNAVLEFVLGAGMAGKTINIYRYDYPVYTLLGPITETLTPGTYTYTLNTNSLYSLQLEEETQVSDDTLYWVLLGAAAVGGAYLLLKPKKIKTK